MAKDGPAKVRAKPLMASQVDEAAHVLARAFLEDPLSVHVWPDPDERARGHGPLFTALIRQALLFGEAWTTPSEVV